MWIGTAIAISGLMLGVALGDSAAAFVNVPGFVFVGLIGFGVVIAAHGPGIVGVLFRALSRKLTDEDRVNARRAAVTGRQAFLAAGWIGLIIGVVQMLSALDDPAHLGTGMATALLTVLYAFMFAYLFWLPLERRLAEV